MNKFIAAFSVAAALLVPAVANADPTDPTPPWKPLKNNLVWFGGRALPGPAQNDNFWDSPSTVQVWTFTPLNTILWAKPRFPKLWSWWDARLNQRCWFGIGTKLGPYGTYTHAYNHYGCDPK
jgi:hypothetical protein